jgi:YVTN family beta-propeller protein
MRASNAHITRLTQNPATHRIYATYTWVDESLYFGDGVEVLGGATNAYVASVSMGAPDFDEAGGVAINPTTNTVKVANSYSDTLSVIDGATNAVVEFALGDRPFAIAVNPTTNSVYITVSGTASGGAGAVVLNGATNAITATVPMDGAPSDLAVDPATNGAASQLRAPRPPGAPADESVPATACIEGRRSESGL